jgi:hypothetical protein
LKELDMAVDPLQFVGICGIGVQRLVEALDPILTAICNRIGVEWKKSAAIVVAVAAGTSISNALDAGYLFDPNIPTHNPGFAFVNGLLIGGGTETFNSLIKMLSSAKEATGRSAVKRKLTGAPHAAAENSQNPPAFAAGATPR